MRKYGSVVAHRSDPPRSPAEAHPVLVVDFGAQYAQLIARRVREARVYSEIVPSSLTAEQIAAREPAGVIFSGGPASVHVEGAPSIDPAIYDLGVPVLGICYGAQLMAQQLGGLVEKTDRGEYGRTPLDVVAPDAVPELANDPDVRWHQRAYQRGEAASYKLVFTATDDPAVNRQVARDGRAANVWVNSADDPANCAFTLPAVVNRGDLQVAISTNGRSPAFAKWLRQRLEAELTDVHGAVVALLGEARAEARAQFGTSELPGWDAVIDDDLIASVAAGHHDAARTRVREALGLSAANPAEPVR